MDRVASRLIAAFGQQFLNQKISSIQCSTPTPDELTLDISNTLLQDLLQGFGVLQLFGDLADDRLGKLALLPCLDLSFISHPRIQYRLGLCCQSSSLLELKGFGLEICGFLKENSVSPSVVTTPYPSR